MKRIQAALFALVLCPFVVLQSANADETATSSINFKRHVEPILVAHCLECHGSDRKGGLDLRTKATALAGGENGNAIVPGNLDDSLLLEYVESGEMPPKEKLKDEEIAVLKKWIMGGADFPQEPLDLYAVTSNIRAGYDWWSLRPLDKSAPPVASDDYPKTWNDNPIDRFIVAGLKKKKLAVSTPADKRTLIRRATYNLTGLPPTVEEIDAFLADDSDNAYEKVIDRLLASRHYGEHWGRHWLDVIRFGESRGYERNEIINNAWPFRDYVIRSFNDDKPFDQMVQEHLAGDVIGKGDPAVEVGITFLTCGPYDDVGNQDAAQAAQIRANTIDDIIRATGESFLGLTIGCGRCHNHKFDPIQQADYYRWYASFAGVFHGNRVVATDEQKKQHSETVDPLNKSRDALNKEKSELEKGILARAETHINKYKARWTRPKVERQLTEETFEAVKVKHVRLNVLGTERNPAGRTGHHIDEFEVWTAEETPRNVASMQLGGTAQGASRQVKDFADAYSPNLTIDGKFGARWLAAEPYLTITLTEPTQINRITFSSDRPNASEGHGVASFVSEYRIEVSTDGKIWKEVANSFDRQPMNSAHRRHRLMKFETTADEKRQLAQLTSDIGQVNRKLSAVPKLNSWWVGNFRQPGKEMHVFVGGDPQKKGDAVVPAGLNLLKQQIDPYKLANDVPEGERRLELANWLVDDKNPLTPRVLANRIWHYHFGKGIVDTPSDFGFMGGKPTHPELLDWLALQIQTNNWQLKSIHKAIMLSQVYQQSSEFREKEAAIDADSRLLWRFPPRRLSAEEIRDTALSVSGKLDKRAGGPGYRLYQYLQDNVATYVPLDKHGPETYRRAVYHQNARAARVDLMTEFDCPDNAFSAPRRASTTTPLQALTMMNHQFTLDMSAALASRVTQQTADAKENQITKQVELAFSLLFSRTPDAAESKAAGQLINDHGLRAFCRALLNSNEFMYLN